MRIRLLVEDLGPNGGKEAIAFIRDRSDYTSQPFPCKIQVCHGTEIGDTTYYNEWEDIDVVFRSEVGS